MDVEHAARAYCALLEQPGPVRPEAFVRDMLTALADVVAAALRLHQTEASDVDPGVDIAYERWRELYYHVGELLASRGGYNWEVDHPFDLDGSDSRRPSPSLGDVSDDLADTWRDLRSGLLALDAGADRDDVASGWREDYWIHWGHHAASAMRALMLDYTNRGHAPKRER